MSIIENQVIIRPYSLSDLAHLYGVTRHTIRTWLKPHLAAIGQKNGRLFTILQVRIIFEKLGLPE